MYLDEKKRKEKEEADKSNKNTKKTTSKPPSNIKPRAPRK